MWGVGGFVGKVMFMKEEVGRMGDGNGGEWVRGLEVMWGRDDGEEEGGEWENVG